MAGGTATGGQGDILQEVTPALTRIYSGGVGVKSELDGLAQVINAILAR